LIQERVRAGLRHARARGKRLGRPGVNVEVKRIRELRAQGASLRAIARKLGVGLGTVHRALPARFKILCGATVVNDRTAA
jgi:DNA invertase Pin-like site-specific DNA recombinase